MLHVSLASLEMQGASCFQRWFIYITPLEIYNNKVGKVNKYSFYVYI